MIGWIREALSESRDGDCRGEFKMTTIEPQPLAALTAELRFLVDQLDAGSESGSPIWEIADQVHRLRVRTEQLLNEPTG